MQHERKAVCICVVLLHNKVGKTAGTTVGVCVWFQVEVGRYMSRSLISVVHIFEGCNDNFLDSLSILLHEVRPNPCQDTPTSVLE